MPFEKCPECGDTNYAEEDYKYRKFDCGFVGFYEDRKKRCGNPKGSAPAIPAEVARYRLALLDAAQAAETISNDMIANGVAPDYAGRCRELARQMRAFAGHTAEFGTAGKGGTPAGKVLSIFRKPWSR